MAQGVPALGVAVGLQDHGDKQVPAGAKGDSSAGGGAEEGPQGQLEEGESKRSCRLRERVLPWKPQRNPCGTETPLQLRKSLGVLKVGAVS